MGATIYNSDATKAILDGARIQASSDRPPSELAEKVIPVLDMTPDFHRITSFWTGMSETTTGTKTIYTTPTDKDFFINTLSLSFAKDATCNIATGTIDIIATAEGAALNIMRLAVLTTTAERDSVTLTFPVPLKLGRGVAITCNGTFTLGALTRGASITGFFKSI